jgi:hypothetical protein
MYPELIISTSLGYDNADQKINVAIRFSVCYTEELKVISVYFKKNFLKRTRCKWISQNLFQRKSSVLF